MSRSGWVLASALLAELILVTLAARFGDFTQSGAVFRFVPLMLLAGGAFLVAAQGFSTVPTSNQTWALWGGAFLLRLAMLGCTPGDDFWRYGWEGRVQNAGYNPYTLSPLAQELTALRDATWPLINHPESPAIYPPGAQLTFAAVTQVFPDPRATFWAFKGLFGVADLLTLGLLINLAGARAAAWYGWNPAVVYAFVGGGHYDSLMLFTLLGAAWALHRAESRRSSRGWEALSGLALGAAIALKLIPIFLLPVWALALGRRAWLLLPGIALPLALAQPFGGLAVVMKPLQAFADVTRFNELLVWIFPNPWQRNWPVTLLLGVTVGVCTLALRRDWRRSAFWVLGAALILSPVLHPWYVTWILPFAVWRQQLPWTLLSLSALSALLLWETTALWTAWQPNLLTRAVVVLPPLLAWRFRFFSHEPAHG